VPDSGVVASRDAEHRGHRAGPDRGSAAIELAILLPVILLAFFSSIQVALLFLARHEALGAAQEAVTAQRAYHAAPDAGRLRARDFLTTSGRWLVGGQVMVTSNGQRVTATVTGTAVGLIPGFKLTVTQHADGQVERITSMGIR
jgi:hypothetical protein